MDFEDFIFYLFIYLFIYLLFTNLYSKERNRNVSFRTPLYYESFLSHQHPESSAQLQGTRTEPRGEWKKRYLRNPLKLTGLVVVADTAPGGSSAKTLYSRAENY